MREAPSTFFLQVPSPNPNNGVDDLWINFAKSPSSTSQHEDPSTFKRHDPTTASAVSFGFIAIAILICMFLVIAIVERLLRPRRSTVISPIHHSHDMDLEFSQMSQRPLQWGIVITKPQLHHPPPASCGVSVVMPGQQVPTFIARPVPIPPSSMSTAKVPMDDLLPE